MGKKVFSFHCLCKHIIDLFWFWSKIWPVNVLWSQVSWDWCLRPGSDQQKLMRIDENSLCVLIKIKIALELLIEGFWWFFELLLFCGCLLWLTSSFIPVICSWSFSPVIGWHWEAKLCCDWSSYTGATSPLDPPNGPYRCFWYDFDFRIPVRMNLWTWTAHIGV